jgi:VID27 PH-like domain
MVSQTRAPPALQLPTHTASKILAAVPAELRLFDAIQGVFMLQEDKVVASVIETGEWDCSLR